MNAEQLFKLKQTIQRKIPAFIRENYGGLKRIRKTWRKPKGLHSKLRHGFAGHRNRVEPGYGTPRTFRGTGKSCLLPQLINTPAELEALNPKIHGAIIAHVGMKKKIDIIKKANEKQITILNLTHPQNYLKKAEEALTARKQTKKKTKTAKQENNKNTDKKTTTSEKQDTNEEEKKQQQKQELDKLLTKKEA